MIARLTRNTAIACAGLAACAAAWSRDVHVVGGVLGGGVLIGFAIWALSGVVSALTIRTESGEIRPVSRGFALVKFFTRHAILALAAYGMMVRLHLDPLGVLAGVSSLVIGVAVEVLRDLRWRRFP